MIQENSVQVVCADSYACTKLPPRDDWAGKIEAGGKYFSTRNGSSTIAFTVGKSYKLGNGVAIVAGHIDALTAKLKPVSKKATTAGYVQLGVAQYAGALNETWWDRDLSIGGRVIVREESGKTTSRLVKLDWPSKNYLHENAREVSLLIFNSCSDTDLSSTLRSRYDGTEHQGHPRGTTYRA